MKISLSSASLAMSARKASAPTSRNSPGSATTPRARERPPEIKTISPEKPPTPSVTNTCSPRSRVITISILPESTTKQAIPSWPGSYRTSPAPTVFTIPYGRMRSICAGVRTETLGPVSPAYLSVAPLIRSFAPTLTNCRSRFDYYLYHLISAARLLIMAANARCVDRLREPGALDGVRRSADTGTLRHHHVSIQTLESAPVIGQWCHPYFRIRFTLA